MKQFFYALGLITLLSTTAFAKQDNDYGKLFKATPIWPDNGVIAEEMADKYVFLDLKAGQMVLAYPPNLDQPDYQQQPKPRLVERFDLNNQVRTSLSIDVISYGQLYTYTYRISNAKQAKLAIWQILMPIPAFHDDDSIIAPADWKAAASASKINAVKVAIGRSDGFFLSWYAYHDFRSLDDPEFPAIQPGNTLDGFAVTSRLKPGFTLAYSRGGVLPRLRGDMPRAVLDQAIPLMQVEVNNENILTIGPKFDVDTPLQEIVQDYQRGIGLMVNAGQLDGRSPAILEIMQVLEACLAASNNTRDVLTSQCQFDFALNARPKVGLEMEVINAMRLSLPQ